MRPNDSKNRRNDLLTRWSQSLAVAALPSDRKLLLPILELFQAVPVDVLSAIVDRPDPILILPPVTGARIVSIAKAFPDGVHLLQLDSRYFETEHYTERERAAILGHEFAHVIGETSSDLEADALVAAWGFSDELRSALKKGGLTSEHERLAALENGPVHALKASTAA